MPDIVIPGEAIEGASICGHSREPLKSLGLETNENKMDVFRLVAKKNVKSRIVNPISSAVTRICPKASISPSVELICVKANIYTVDEKRISIEVGSNITGTHGSLVWTFQTQTAVKIVQGHQGLLNGYRNRMLQKAVTV